MKRSAAWLIGIAAALVLFGMAAWWFADFVADNEFPDVRPPPTVAGTGARRELSTDDASRPARTLPPASDDAAATSPDDEARARPTGAPATVHIRGRVLDSDNDMVIGMSVVREGEPGTVLAVSDSVGSFEIEVANTPGALVATDRGWVTVKKILLPLPEAVRDDTIVVLPALQFAGVVHDADKLPLADARVHVDVPLDRLVRIDSTIDAASMTTCSALTGKDGAFELPDVPWFERGEIVVDLEGFKTTRLPLSHESRLALDVEMWREHDPRLLIEGIVVHADGSPARRARVRLGSSITPASESGSFSLEFERSEARAPLRAIESGFQQAVMWRQDWAANEAAADRRGVKLVLGPPSLTLRGRVLEADGRPGEGWSVSLAGPSGNRDATSPLETGLPSDPDLVARTDAHGEFGLDGLSNGVYVVSAWQSGSLEAIGPQRVAPPFPEMLVLRDESGANRFGLRARVIGRDKAPIENATVTLCLVVERNGSMFAQISRTVKGPQTWTAKDGTFSFPSVPDADVCFEIDGVWLEPLVFDPRDRLAPKVDLRGSRPVEIVATRRGMIELTGSRRADGPNEVSAVDRNGELLSFGMHDVDGEPEALRANVAPGSVVRLMLSPDTRRLVLFRDGTPFAIRPVEIVSGEISRASVD